MQHLSSTFLSPRISSTSPFPHSESPRSASELAVREMSSPVSFWSWSSEFEPQVEGTWTPLCTFPRCITVLYLGPMFQSHPFGTIPRPPFPRQSPLSFEPPISLLPSSRLSIFFREFSESGRGDRWDEEARSQRGQGGTTIAPNRWDLYMGPELCTGILHQYVHRGVHLSSPITIPPNFLNEDTSPPSHHPSTQPLTPRDECAMMLPRTPLSEA